MREYKIKCSGSVTVTVEDEDKKSAFEKASLRVEDYTAHEIIDDYTFMSYKEIREED
jgi:propanediol utilization protein